MVFLITFLKCLIQRGAKPGVSFLKLLHFDRRFFKGLTGMFYRFSRLPQLLGLFYNFGLASVTTADNFSPKRFRHSVPTVYSILWARWASNPHPLRDTILSRARIPIPPLALSHHFNSLLLNSPSGGDFILRPGGDSHPRIPVLQTDALTASPPGRAKQYTTTQLLIVVSAI